MKYIWFLSVFSGIDHVAQNYFINLQITDFLKTTTYKKNHIVFLWHRIIIIQISWFHIYTRCQANAVWDFGDLRCEGPVCADPGRPIDGFQVARSYEQSSEVEFGCNRPGYILINPRPITCIREPECKVVKPLGLASGAIPDSAINATSERWDKWKKKGPC